MIEKNTYVVLDEHGFVTQTMITGVPPPNVIPAPDIVENSLELLTNNYYFEGGTWKTLGKTPKNYKVDKILKIFVPDLEATKLKKYEEIKQKRIEEVNYGIVYNGNLFDLSQKSQINIGLAAELAKAKPDDWTITWILKDNSSVVLTKQEIIELNLKVAEKLIQLHEHSQALREQINSSTTVEEVEEVIW